jgi:hypothetical protein
VSRKLNDDPVERRCFALVAERQDRPPRANGAQCPNTDVELRTELQRFDVATQLARLGVHLDSPLARTDMH